MKISILRRFFRRCGSIYFLPISDWRYRRTRGIKRSVRIPIHADDFTRTHLLIRKTIPGVLLFLFVIGYTGLFLSHLVIAMYFTIFLILFFLVFMRKLFTREVFPKLLLAVGIVTLLVLPFFFVTVIEHNLFGNYVVYADGEMAGLDYMEYYSMDLRTIL